LISFTIIPVNLGQNLINPNKLLIDLSKYLLSDLAELNFTDSIWLYFFNKVDQDFVSGHPLDLNVLHCHVDLSHGGPDSLDFVLLDPVGNNPDFLHYLVVLVERDVLDERFEAKHHLVVHPVVLGHDVLHPLVHLD